MLSPFFSQKVAQINEFLNHLFGDRSLAIDADFSMYAFY